jgi:osmotically-inducible protein OsmY
MRRVVRRVLAFAAAAAAMLALEAAARRRGSSAARAVRALLDLVRPEVVADDTIEARVRRRLARTARDPDAIIVSIEHGCVDLRGPVETRERARVVRAVATVPGVDSVLDLMTEPGASF